MITIYGASDDLIEIGGDITEEWDVPGHETGTITLSDQTVISYALTDEDDGTWRFKVDRPMQAKIEIIPAGPELDPTYSDRVQIEGDIEWVRLDATGEKVAR